MRNLAAQLQLSKEKIDRANRSAVSGKQERKRVKKKTARRNKGVKIP